MLAAALAVLGPIRHGFRLLHPVRWGADVTRFSDDFSAPMLAEGRWRIGGAGASSVRWKDRQAVIAPPRGVSGFLEALLPEGAHVPLPSLLPSRLLGGCQPATCDDDLRWRATNRLDGEYFVLLEWGPLLIQRTSYGIHVTAPDQSGRPSGQQIALAGLEGSHSWQVHRAQERTALALDGQVVWTGPALDLGRRPRFGETRSDSLHAGELALLSVSFRSALAPRYRLPGR